MSHKYLSSEYMKDQLERFKGKAYNTLSPLFMTGAGVGIAVEKTFEGNYPEALAFVFPSLLVGGVLYLRSREVSESYQSLAHRIEELTEENASLSDKTIDDKL